MDLLLNVISIILPRFDVSQLLLLAFAFLFIAAISMLIRFWLFYEYYFCCCYYYYHHYYHFIFFHQFEQDVLEACLFLLERGWVAMTEWRDPVIVSRMVSALVSHIHMTLTYIHRKSSIWPWFEKVNSSGTACGSFRFMGISFSSPYMLNTRAGASVTDVCQ